MLSGKLRASLLGRKSAACTPSFMREIIRRKPSTGPVLVMSHPVSSVSADRERPRLRKRRRCKLAKSDLLRPPSRSLASIVIMLLRPPPGNRRAACLAGNHRWQDLGHQERERDVDGDE